MNKKCRIWRVLILGSKYKYLELMEHAKIDIISRPCLSSDYPSFVSMTSGCSTISHYLGLDIALKVTCNYAHMQYISVSSFP